MINRKVLLLFTFIAFLCFFPSCNGDNGKSIIDNGSDDTGNGLVVAGQINYTAEECSVEGQNEFVYRVMTDTYLWYDQVQQVDPGSFDSPEELLDNIRYDELDRWSYIADQEDYYSYYEEGQYIGLGFYMIYDSEEGAMIMYVYDGSPAAGKGIERGDKIIEINDKPVEEIETANEWDEAFGENTEGELVKLLVEKLDNTQVELTIEKDTIIINTVLYQSIIERDGVKVGYLVFKSFLMTSLNELTPVFEWFKEEGVEELVLDLRYNGGGRSVVAKYLADLIGGEKADGKTFQKFIHNDKYTNWNNDIRFSSYPISLNLERVVVISTELTASASEMVVNGLIPYVDVILVGKTTSGKPVGMYGHDFCDKHISPIEFKLANANDESDYFEGINPDCTADDDAARQFGDEEEDSLKEALYYLTHNECSEGRKFTADKRHISAVKGKRRKEVRKLGLEREIGAF